MPLHTRTRLDKIGMHDNSEFLKFLEQQALQYRGILEDMFGPRDQRFVFGSIKKSIDEGDIPYTYFPNGFHFNGGCVVDVHISGCPWQKCYRNQGTWQLAHESVHLLDPGKRGTATFLEEGLATWFQDEPKYHIDVVKKYIEQGQPHTRYYEEAKELVWRCIPQLTSAVKEVRSSGMRIRDITADVLAPCLRNVDRATITRLCTRFSY